MPSVKKKKRPAHWLHDSLYRRAIEFIGAGTTMNDFFAQFEHQASILLSHLITTNRVTTTYVRPFQITVIMPVKEGVYPHD